MSSKRGKGSGPLGAVAGIVGVACLGWAAAGVLGLVGTGGREPASVPVRSAPEAAARMGEGVAATAADGRTATSRVVEMATRASGMAPMPVAAGAVPAERASHYPLEVGRYWVYRYEDPRSGTVAEVERAIVRREHRGGRDLFHFADGTVVYVEEGKVYELGADGGVNVIPLDPRVAAPYVYRSQGMQIAKQIGAVDTVLVAGGRQYEDCVEVITRFRALEDGASPAISYSSFYARGIGLVGRERWPRGSGRNLSVELDEHGTRQL